EELLPRGAVRRVPRHHDPDPVRRGRRGAGRHRGRRRVGRPRLHRLGVGHRRDAGRLRRGPHLGGAPQPGGDDRPGRLQGLLLAEGAALLAGPDRRRVRGGPDRPVRVLRPDHRARPGADHRLAGHLLHPAGQRVGARHHHHGVLRPDRRHRDPRLRDLRADDGDEQPAAGQHRPVHRRPAGRRHRHGLGHQRRLRHQPRPRLRAPAAVVHHRLRDGLGRPERHALLVVADRGPDHRRAHRRGPVQVRDRGLPAHRPRAGDGVRAERRRRSRQRPRAAHRRGPQPERL
ncbi:MAG: Glycerol uptake facilitator protein, partial [uncultured Pseudonocardia sp.]